MYFLFLRPFFFFFSPFPVLLRFSKGLPHSSAFYSVAKACPCRLINDYYHHSNNTRKKKSVSTAPPKLLYLHALPSSPRHSIHDRAGHCRGGNRRRPCSSTSREFLAERAAAGERRWEKLREQGNGQKKKGKQQQQHTHTHIHKKVDLDSPN